MKLHNILSGISYVCIVLGLLGLMGAIEYETGYLESILLLILGAIIGVWAGYESGYFRRRKKDVHGI